MRKLLEYLLSFFKKTKKESEINDRIKVGEEKLEEIENEKTDIDDVIDRLNQ